MATEESIPDGGTRRRAATRERLLDAARELLARDGIQGASVEHICDRAGFSRGAFYSNFAGKDDLILAMFNREKAMMLKSVKAAADIDSVVGVDGTLPVGTIMERFFALQPVDRDWFLVHTEFIVHGIRHEEVGLEFNEVWRETKREFIGLMVSVLGSLGRRFTIEPDHAATILMGTYELALREAVMEGRGIDTELLRETLPRLLLSVTEASAG